MPSFLIKQAELSVTAATESTYLHPPGAVCRLWCLCCVQLQKCPEAETNKKSDFL